MTEAERCRAEIAAALAVVMETCCPGAYVGLTDWQAELRLIEMEEQYESATNCRS